MRVPICPEMSRFLPVCPLLSQFVPVLGPPQEGQKRTNGDKTGHFGTHWETPPFRIRPHLAFLETFAAELRQAAPNFLSSLVVRAPKLAIANRCNFLSQLKRPRHRQPPWRGFLRKSQVEPQAWRVPNPPGANPLVAERAFPTSDYWGRTGVARCAEEMTGICRDFQQAADPLSHETAKTSKDPFSYQGVNTRGVRHSPASACAFPSQGRFL